MLQPWIAFVEEATTALELMEAWLLLETSLNPRWLESPSKRWEGRGRRRRVAGVFFVFFCFFLFFLFFFVFCCFFFVTCALPLPLLCR